MGKDEIIKDSQIHAEENGFKLNPDHNIVEHITEGIAENERNFGKRYCSCRAFAGDKNDDSVCPCIWHKEEIETKGRCHCGLFIKKK